MAKGSLDRAFLDTYGLSLNDVFHDLDLALGTYRWSVASILPTMTKVAWAARKDQIVTAAPGRTKRKFVYILSRSSYEKEWGANYERPGIGARLLALLFKLFPKIGPFRAFSFKAPTRETELLFMKSFDATFDRYRALLGELTSGRLQLTNQNLDTGQPTRAGGYNLADDAYASLLEKLADKRFTGMSPELRGEILEYYADLDRPIATKRRRAAWRKTLEQLDQLKSAPLQSAADAWLP